MSKIPLATLATLCRNVGISLDAGVDIRRVWKTEQKRQTGMVREHIKGIADDLAAGESLTESMKNQGDFFPSLVIDMVEVGEESGRTEVAFSQLAEYYQYMIKLRRDFLGGLAWPVFQLGLSIIVVGLLIWLFGVLGQGYDGPKMSVFGLSGVRGLIIYCLVVGSTIGILVLAVLALMKGWINLDPLVNVAMRLPGVGLFFETLAMSRLTWSLAMATDTGLEVKKTVDLALRSTNNPYYRRVRDPICDDLMAGHEMHEAFRATGRFPRQFLDVLESAEMAGKTSDALRVLHKDYAEKMKLQFKTLQAVSSILVFLMVAGIIITMIFQIASNIAGVYNEFL